MNQPLIRTNIVLCSVLKRINRFEYFIQAFQTNYVKCIGMDKFVIEPRFIFVNGIKFKAHLADQSFIDTTLKGKKSLYIIDNDSDERLLGDIYLLPTDKSLQINIPPSLNDMVNRFIDSDFKLVG